MKNHREKVVKLLDFTEYCPLFHYLLWKLFVKGPCFSWFMFVRVTFQKIRGSRDGFSYSWIFAAFGLLMKAYLSKSPFISNFCLILRHFILKMDEVASTKSRCYQAFSYWKVRLRIITGNKNLKFSYQTGNKILSSLMLNHNRNPSVRLFFYSVTRSNIYHIIIFNVF